MLKATHPIPNLSQTHLRPLSPDIREVEDEVGEIDEFFDVSETRTPHALQYLCQEGWRNSSNPTLSQSKLPRLEITSNIDTTNIIEGGRTCRSSCRAAYLAELNVLPHDLLGYRSVYTTAIHLDKEKMRLHSDQLLGPPSSWKEMLKHLFPWSVAGSY